MQRQFKRYVWILIIIIVFNLFCSCSIKDESVNALNSIQAPSDVRLVLDSLNYSNIIKNFRKTCDLALIKSDNTLNIKGLSRLNISGSKQFSELNFPILVKNINTKFPITVIDLRQESHGFINGFPVSWKSEKNDANIGLTKEQVIEDEENKLKSIKLNSTITFTNFPEQSILVKKVQSEKELVSCHCLGYIRIPVTDGKMPTDDMVDYFVNMVKAQAKDTWLHFHCKEGIGRTTTFMIMYDMMKNSDKATADEIVKRQIMLGNLNLKDSHYFYDNERINFLSDFYKYVKENKPLFNSKYSEWKKTITTSNSSFLVRSNYIKNAKKPNHLYIISEDGMSYSERILIATLQGLVNSKSSRQIYTLNSNQPDYKIWLQDMKNNYGVSYEIIKDPWILVDKFKEFIDGYVLYDSKNAGNPSVNNACSLASLNKSIAVDEKIEGKVKEHGIIKVKGDCRNTGKGWAYDNLWDKGLNHSIVIELAPDRDALRDYAMMTKSLIFYEDDINDETLRGKIFSSMKGESMCLGWGPDEFINISLASKYGVSMVAADWSYNLTVLSSFPNKPLKQKPSPELPEEKDVHYVTFIMSDGDNQQWNLGTNYGDSKWYGSPYRGDLNLAWTLSPSLYYLAPTVFNNYYRNASKGKYNDYFLVPPSGNGYMYPSKFNKDKLNPYLVTLNNYMKDVDQRYLVVIDDGAFYDNKLWSKFTSKSKIEGVFYLDYHRHDNYHGEILWVDNKPIVSCRDLLWSGLEDEEQLVKKINERVATGQTDITKTSAYTFVYVHVWSKDMASVEKVKNELLKNPKVRIVDPDKFMKFINKNIKR